MTEPSEEIAPMTEELQPLTEAGTDLRSTEAPQKAKAVRTEAQKLALQKARENAMAVRAENAALKQKEREVEKALLERAKAERAAKVEADYNALTQSARPPPIAEEEEEEVAPPPKKRRKPARRVIVTEASSGTDEDEEVEVVLPKKKASAAELAYQRATTKMFYFY